MELFLPQMKLKLLYRRFIGQKASRCVSQSRLHAFPDSYRMTAYPTTRQLLMLPECQNAEKSI